MARSAISFFLLVLVFTARAQVTFESSNLPIVVINTNGQEILDDPKITADMGIINNADARNLMTDAFTDYSGKIGIEIRGSSSQSFPKKQYGIELRDAEGNGIDASLLGLPAEEDWVLFAPYNDKALMRDMLAYRLARSLGHYAPRTRYCELVLNGEYMGVYVLIEKIKRDKNRVNINKLDPDEISGNNLTGGYIIKIDKTTGGGDGWNSTFAPPNRGGSQQVTFLYEEPEWDEIVPEQKQYIQQYLQDFETTLAGANFKDPVNGYAKYIDVNSFIDYFIINEVSKNVDGYRLSTFFHKKRDSDGGKIHMGPVWDYNLGFGNADYCTNGDPEGFVLDFNNICPDDFWLIPFWWKRLQQDRAYRQLLIDRWTALRTNELSTETIHAIIDSAATLLNAESQQRNFERWPVLGTYVWPNYFVGDSFDEEVDWLKDWTEDRMTWLDVNITGLITSEEAEASGFSSLSVFPNPAPQVIQFEYELVNPGLLEVSMTDSRGVKQQLSPVHRGYAGKFVYRQDLPATAPGVYLLRVSVNGAPAIQRRVVVIGK
jgi:hypothetical protein